MRRKQQQGEGDDEEKQRGSNSTAAELQTFPLPIVLLSAPIVACSASRVPEQEVVLLDLITQRSASFATSAKHVSTHVQSSPNLH